MKSLPRIFLFCFASSLLTLTLPVFNATSALAGTLDPSFGNGGIVTTNVMQDDTPIRVYLLSDGKILVAGQTGKILVTGQTGGVNAYSSLLVRYNNDGTLDNTFGIGGIVNGGQGNLEIRDSLLQPDGKIVLVGGINPGVSTPPDDFVVLRFNSDGTPDSSFGANGVVITSIRNLLNAASAVVLLPDSKLLVAGTSKGSNGAGGSIDLVRYNGNGTLDTTFGAGGIIYYISNDHWPTVYEIALLSDGKLLMSGSTHPLLGVLFFLARFESNGSYDTTFGAGNGIIFPVSTDGEITLQPDGKFLIPSSYGGGFAVSRFNSNGTMDIGFGFHGVIHTNFRAQTGTASGSATQVLLKSNGEIIVVGTANHPNGSQTSAFAASHFSPNGTLIARTTISFPQSPMSIANRAALQPDGKIIIAGTVDYLATGSDVAVARLTSITNDFRPNRKTYDFDGDFKDDLTTYIPGTGGGSSLWHDFSFWSPNFAFGLNEDIIVPADYTGNGIAQLAVFRPSTGYWYIANGLTNLADFTTIQWGTVGDVPVASDYDGDAKADVAVFRPDTGEWFILNSLNGSQAVVQWGIAEDKPVAGDYDGDTKADVAVYRPSNSNWYVLRSSDGQMIATHFGMNGDQPVAADYDGDNTTDFAVFRPSNGVWYVRQSSSGVSVAQPWGMLGDIPAPGDYDGDGKTDFAIWRPSIATWYIINSSDGSVTVKRWGGSTDIPVPGN